MVTNVFTRRYDNRVKLFTSASIPMKVTSFPDSIPNTVDLSEYSNIEDIVNPDIATVSIKVISTCRNRSCAEVMDINETLEFQTCPNGHTMITSRVLKQLNCSIVIEISDVDVEMTIPESVIKSSENMKRLPPTEIERCLLMFRGILSYNSDTSEVTSLLFQTSAPNKENTDEAAPSSDEQQ